MPTEDEKPAESAVSETGDEKVPEDDAGGVASLTYEQWLDKQPDEVKALVGANEHGLRSALDSERESRKELEGKLREMAEKAGAELRKQLEETADELAEVTRKNDFYELAHQAGVVNLRLAYLAIKTDELYDRKGNADLVELKNRYPELFAGASAPASKQQAPAINAGSGTTTSPPAPSGMNEFIRSAAGRG